MDELLKVLKEYQLTIASCESFTAGLFCSELGAISGASAVLKGGLVTYTNQAKIHVANVDDTLIRRYGAISEQCVIKMATHTKDMFHSDIGVAFSGNAGPNISENKPAGLLYCAIAFGEETRVYQLKMNKERNEIRKEAVIFLANQVIQWIYEKGNSYGREER